MHDTNSLLLILQASSLTVTLCLALVLLFSKFHQPDTSENYEKMRLCNIFAQLLLCLHYFCRIHFGFRAQGADVGAEVNILFYALAIYIFTYSYVRLASRQNLPKRMLVQYLREVEGKTFRVWLSDLRLEEAKRLIMQHPEYANETIAEACGFSLVQNGSSILRMTSTTTSNVLRVMD